VAIYQVQGRRTERNSDGKVRDVVRLESATSRSAAFAIAEIMAADRLTAWVFSAETRSGRWSYTLLGVRPDPGA
jgi:hypothetical protein